MAGDRVIQYCCNLHAFRITQVSFSTLLPSPGFLQFLLLQSVPRHSSGESNHKPVIGAPSLEAENDSSDDEPAECAEEDVSKKQNLSSFDVLPLYVLSLDSS